MLKQNNVTTPYVGIDIGGTSTRIGLFESLGTTEFTLISRFATCPNYQEQLHAISSSLQTSASARFKGVGVSIGGRLAKDGSGVAVAPNLPDYEGKPFVRDLTNFVDCPVRLAHDTVCGLLAEKKFGYIQTIDRSAYLTLSTGTGAAFQLRKDMTTLTVSIEIGHQILDGNTLVCLCGQIGCLETFTGGKQLEMRYGHTLAQISDTAFWEQFCQKLAIGLVNLAQLTRVESIAVSGAIALNNAFLIPLLQQHVNALMKGMTLEITVAVLGENAPVVGAVQLLETPEGSLLH